MKKRLLFIFNPRAGKEKIKMHLSDILNGMTAAGYDVTVHVTQGQGDAMIQTRERASEFDRVVCSGGDGTLDEVVNGMMQLEQRIPIGYIPAGSTNDFGNSLGIDKDMLNAAQISLSDHFFPCDIGAFNDSAFVYVAAFGLFTEVSYQTSQELKNMFGHAAYVMEGAKQLWKVPSYKMKVTANGECIEDEFIFGMLTNAKSVGGFKDIIPGEIELNDGLFELTFVKKPNNPIETNEILGFLLGITPETKMIYTMQTAEVRIECEEEVPWTLDGEYGGSHRTVYVKNKPKAVEFIIQ